MKHEGPPLELLTSHLADCPEELLTIHDRPRPVTRALVADTLRDLGFDRPTPAAADLWFQNDTRDHRRLVFVRLACWLLHHPWFCSSEFAIDQQTAELFFDVAFARLSKVMAAEKMVHDPERREEFVRLILSELGYFPEGETAAHAQDRLTTLDSVERIRLAKETAFARQRAKALREAMQRRAARETAATYGRE